MAKYRFLDEDIIEILQNKLKLKNYQVWRLLKEKNIREYENLHVQTVRGHLSDLCKKDKLRKDSKRRYDINPLELMTEEEINKLQKSNVESLAYLYKEQKRRENSDKLRRNIKENVKKLYDANIKLPNPLYTLLDGFLKSYMNVLILKCNEVGEINLKLSIKATIGKIMLDQIRNERQYFKENNLPDPTYLYYFKTNFDPIYAEHNYIPEGKNALELTIRPRLQKKKEPLKIMMDGKCPYCNGNKYRKMNKGIREIRNPETSEKSYNIVHYKNLRYCQNPECRKIILLKSTSESKIYE